MKNKIMGIGSNIESFITLKYLISNGVTISTLITRPNGNNKGVSDYYDLHPICQEHGIDTVDTVNVNAAETIEAVRKQSPDYLLTFGWSQIFKEDFINSFDKMVIGSHPTALPYGRGRAPIPWTILMDLKVSAVSFFRIDKGVDSGELLLQSYFQIPNRVYAYELYEMTSECLAKGFATICSQISKGISLEGKAQSLEVGNETAKRVPAHGLIDFSSDVEEVDRLVRAVSRPYPGAYFYYKDTRCIVHRCEPLVGEEFIGVEGQILKKKEDSVLICCKNGAVWLSDFIGDDGYDLSPEFFKLHDTTGYSVQDEIYRLRKKITGSE